MLILSASDVRTVLDMDRAIRAVRRAYLLYSRGEVDIPIRQHLNASSGTTLIMPAHLAAEGVSAVKIVSVYPDNPAQGLPSTLGAQLLLDGKTGRPLALLDAGSLTAIRTGASGALAAEKLARKDARVACLFGAGVQGRTQVSGLLQVLDELREVRLFDINEESTRRMAEEMAGSAEGSRVNWKVVSSPEQAVAGADVVVCATTSSRPVFSGEYLDRGTHVTAVGAYREDMRELDATTLRRADKVVVDSREACWEEAGELIQAVNSGEVDREGLIFAEIGEIVAGEAPGRQNEEEITVFKAVGVAALDVAAAWAAYRGARAEGAGLEVKMA